MFESATNFIFPATSAQVDALMNISTGEHYGDHSWHHVGDLLYVNGLMVNRERQRIAIGTGYVDPPPLLPATRAWDLLRQALSERHPDILGAFPEQTWYTDGSQYRDEARFGYYGAATTERPPAISPGLIGHSLREGLAQLQSLLDLPLLYLTALDGNGSHLASQALLRRAKGAPGELGIDELLPIVSGNPHSLHRDHYHVQRASADNAGVLHYLRGQTAMGGEEVRAVGERIGRGVRSKFTGPIFDFIPDAEGNSLLLPDDIDGGAPLVGLAYEHLVLLFGTSTLDGGSRLTAMSEAIIDPSPQWQALSHWYTQGVDRAVERYAVRRINARRANAQRNISRLTSEAQSYLSSYLNAVRALESAEALVAGVDARLDGQDERGMAKVMRMLEKGVITYFGSTGDDLRFHSRHVYIKDPRSGVWHDIGRFEARLNPETGAVRFQNLTRRNPHGSFNSIHPHVNASGAPCLGNLSGMLANLMARRDWGTMVEMVMAYLESVNTNDGAGSGMNVWPAVAHPERFGLAPYPAGERPVPLNGKPLCDEPEDDETDFGEFTVHHHVRRGDRLFTFNPTGYWRSGYFDQNFIDPHGYDWRGQQMGDRYILPEFRPAGMQAEEEAA